MRSLALLSLLVAVPASAQTADLLFSEYVEGSSFNKAVEIYNGTGAPVDLAAGGYVLELYSNGSATVSTSAALSGTVAPGDVYVVSRSNADPAIVAQADLLDSGVSNFNGDDALALRKNGALVDLIGQIGVRTVWGTPPTSTQDNTIRRKPAACTGDANPDDAFDPAVDYDGFAINTFDGLGAHTATCAQVGDAAPAVQSTSPASGSVNVDRAATLAVTFTEAVTVQASAVTLECETDVPVAFAQSGSGTATLTVDPAADLPAGETCTLTVRAAGVSDVDANDPPDTPAADVVVTFTTAGGAPTPISQVQGPGAASPLAGQQVVVEAVVVGDFQDGAAGANGDLNGFYLQEEDADADGDPATSEGLFVFDGSAPTVDVAVGDLVRVAGTVGEFNGSTQLSDVTVTVVGPVALPTPATVTLPVASLDELEAVENMSVRLPQALTVSEAFNFDRFGEVVLGLPPDGLDRIPQYTAFYGTDPAGFTAYQDLIRRSTVTLDDGLTAQNPNPVRHPNGAPFTVDNRFRAGDTVTDAAGVLAFSFGAYRIQPTEPATVTPANPRPAEPGVVAGSHRTGAFNVLNYFNGDGAGGGFPTSRGADTPAELQRQTAKLVAAIVGLDADALGLVEIENDPDGPTSALDDLVEAVNAELGAGTYDYVRTGVLGTDEIKTAVIFKPAAVTPVGAFAALTDPAFTRPNGGTTQRNRPALAQTFRQSATGGVYTLVVNHLKSKGSGCGAGDDSPVQGNCNGTRTAAAAALMAWVAGDPTGSGDPDVLIVGDLNAYDLEDPIARIVAGPDGQPGNADDYQDLVRRFNGENAYSFVFQAGVGYLDYALASPTLAAQVTGSVEWHANADEPDLVDYNLDFGRNPALYQPNAFRASDHDPVLVGLDLAGADQTVTVGALYNPSPAQGDGAGYRLLGAPVPGVTVTDLAALNLVQGVPAGADPAAAPAQYPNAGHNVYPSYVGAGSYPRPAADDVLVPGRGFFWYLYDQDVESAQVPASFGPGTSDGVELTGFVLRAQGTPLAADQAVAFPDYAGDDFHMLANPFARPLAVSGITAAGGTLQGAAVQAYDPSIRGYVTLTGADRLSVWQGAFGQLVPAASGGAVTVTYAYDATDAAAPPEFYGVTAEPVVASAQGAPETPTVRLALTGTLAGGQTVGDRSAMVRVRDGALAGWDALDLSKLTSPSDAHASVAPVIDRDGARHALAIDSRPAGADVVAPLAFTATASGSFALSWDLDLPDGWTATLRDLDADAEVTLRPGASYAFDAPASRAAERFVLTVRPARATDGEAAPAGGATLSGAQPNPVRGRTRLWLTVPAPERVRATVYDALGRVVAVAFDGDAAGRTEIAVDGAGLAPGVYSVRVEGETFAESRRLTVVR